MSFPVLGCHSKKFFLIFFDTQLEGYGLDLSVFRTGWSFAAWFG